MSGIAQRRRFYKEAAVVPIDGAFGIRLDGKPLRTPAGKPLVVPTADLAQAIAGEWDAVPEDGAINPKKMPMMRFVATALDRVTGQRDAVIDELVAYGGSDLLCYRAHGPSELVRRQVQIWQPWLDWAKRDLSASLIVTEGVMPVAQDAAALAALRKAVAAHDDLVLSGLHALTAALGSLVLALAVVRGKLPIAAAADAADLDSQFQAERWGEDHEAMARRARLRADIESAGRYLRHLGVIA